MNDFLTLGIPFFFTLAVVYGALQTAKVFENKRINGLIAVVLAAFVITSTPTLSFLNVILPYAIALFVVIFLLHFLKKAFQSEKGHGNYTGLFISLGLILLFFAHQQSIGGVIDLGFSKEFLTTAAVVVVLIILYGAYQAGVKK